MSETTARCATVLIVGGYGAFGARAAERMLRWPDVDIVISGRDAGKAEAQAAALSRTVGRAVRSAAIDTTTATATDLKRLGATIVLNAAGPYQNVPATLARAAIAARCHYVDLADDRGFVCGIATLDAAAKAADVLVVSGASTVPAVSAAVVDAHAAEFARLTSITYGVSPGDSFDPGLATVQSILSYIGKPFPVRLGGKTMIAYGWQPLRRQRFGALGNRWLGACEIPDLSLLPARYPTLETLRFGAGTEVPIFHLGMWLLSWAVRARLMRHPERYARTLLALKRHLKYLGSDAGGMAMILEGVGPNGKPRRREWSLVARSGHGPYIPPTPALLVVRKLIDGRLSQRGAMPCVGLLTLPEIEAELSDLDMEIEAS